MRSLLRKLWVTVRRTVSDWIGRGVFHWGAALAYYALISLAPAILLGVTAVGKLVGTTATREKVVEQAGFWLGANAQLVVADVVDRVRLLTFDSLWVVPTVLLLLVGATAFFANTQTALNEIWGLQPKTGVVRNVLRTRVMAMLMLLVLGSAVVLSIVLSAAGQIALQYVPEHLNGALLLGRLLEVAVTLSVLTLLLGLTFRILPDAQIAWRDVLVGSFFSAVLLYLGKVVLGHYLGSADLGTAFGAAGSLFTFLVWIYYSAQIFLVGAIFTRKWADLHGSAVRPESYATRVERRVLSGPGPARDRPSAEGG